MGYFSDTEGSTIIFNMYTAFMILLVAVVVIAIVKSFPKLIKTKRNRDTGTIGQKMDKSFQKTESDMKKRS